jgi:hypothetical protein
VLIVITLAACLESDNPNLYANPEFPPDEDRSGCVVTTPPDELKFDPFYSKYCSAQGISIVASEEVDDLALQQAYYIIINMLSPIPDVRDQLIADGKYIAIIGKDQEQTTLPEYSHMDSIYWDARARGLGAGHGILVTSCGEENLLCLGRGQDRYFGENILIHEFAHTIHLSGQGSSFNSFNNKLSRLYYTARRNDLWENTYAMTNPEEYWAEGVQSYFSSNINSYFTDGVHNRIDTREELAAYDPVLYEFIASTFDYFAWEPTCPD